MLASPILAAGLLLLAGYDPVRAERNYVALAEGRIQPGQLTAVELDEVRRLDAERRRLRTIQRETKAECLERERSSEPSRLESAVADLKCSQRDD
jgi:hypothetical protein